MTNNDFIGLVNTVGVDDAWDSYWKSFEANRLAGVPDEQLQASYDRITALYDQAKGLRSTEAMAARKLFAGTFVGKHPVDEALARHGGHLWSRGYIDGHYQKQLADYYRRQA